ncbi:hypothetical protein C2845_PM01G26050 [Panicum miliaceum]|uniref:Uncharacterized protein n=1 Tax=Panicum miliaceum TaxID=4540 RepID=A0A3L6TT10_PANMI|nr:hypothetical protein C2845_PM01G26050 [Panicum miliaceum]
MPTRSKRTERLEQHSRDLQRRRAGAPGDLQRRRTGPAKEIISAVAALADPRHWEPQALRNPRRRCCLQHLQDATAVSGGGGSRGPRVSGRRQQQRWYILGRIAWRTCRATSQAEVTGGKDVAASPAAMSSPPTFVKRPQVAIPPATRSGISTGSPIPWLPKFAGSGEEPGGAPELAAGNGGLVRGVPDANARVQDGCFDASHCWSSAAAVHSWQSNTWCSN